MKRLLFIFLVLVNMSASAQLIQKNTTYGIAFNRTGADTLLYLPADTFTVPTAYRSYNFVARKGTTVYLWNTSTIKWDALAGGGGSTDTTSLSNRIDNKWSKDGNTGTTAGTNFIGTTDAVAFVIKTNNTERARVLSGGNIGIGTASPAYPLDVAGKIGINGAQVVYRPDQTNFTGSLFYGNGGTNLSHTSGSTGMYNTGTGINALDSVTTGYFNTAHGANALKNLTTGNSNTATGVNALFSLKSGTENVANGLNALYSLTTGDYNTANGFSAGLNLTTGQTNVILGNLAMYQSTTSLQCVSIGYRNLQNQTTGYYNNSVGYRGMELLTTGYGNSGLGLHNLSRLTTGYFNTGVGYYAGDALTTGRSNFFGGNYAGNDARQKVDAVHSFGIGSYSFTTQDYQGVIGSVDSTYTLNLYAKDTARLWVNKTTAALTALSSGNIGIGTQSPAKLFHVDGTVRFSSLGTASGDTSTYKPLGINSSGDIIGMTSWPGGFNINSLTSDTTTVDDEIAFSDVNNSNTIKKTTVENILSSYVKDYRVKYGYDFFTDFMGGTIATTVTSNDVSAQNTGTGAASSTITTSVANRPGAVRSATGTTTTGRAGVSNGLSTFFLGGGTWVYETSINIATLSNGTERYQLAIGFVDNLGGANQIDGVYFLYDEGGVSTGSSASANWQLVTTSNSTRTFSTSSTAVASASWVTLRVEVNAAGTRADFFINGTNVGNITSNIPNASGRELGFGWLLNKSAGTTSRTVDFDYLMVQNEFTTAR